jgi:hypothetical protein
VIASSTSVTIAAGGKILANGGIGGFGRSPTCDNPCVYAGGSGAGGSVRLVAPTVDGSGTVQVAGGGAYCTNCPTVASGGWIRVEAFNNARAITGTGSWAYGSPISAYVPTAAPPAVTVIQIADKPLANPKGEFTPADVTVNASGPIEIQIRARGVPVGTIAKVFLFSLEGLDQEISSTPLSGTLQDSTATATVTLPAGFTRGYVRAKW